MARTRPPIQAAAVCGCYNHCGSESITGKTHVHDLHATLLHHLGLDHERLTYRYAGRDFRLTDVFGSGVSEVME